MHVGLHLSLLKAGKLFKVLVGKATPHANANLLITAPSSFRISSSTKLGKWTVMWLPV